MEKIIRDIRERPVRALLEGAVGYLVGLALILGAQYTTNALLPFSYYVDFEAVTPAHEPFKVGEDMIFYSVYGSVRDIYDVRWTDTLYCDYDKDKNGYFSVGQSVYETGGWEPDKTAQEKDWRLAWQYFGVLPKKPATCYMRAVMQILLPHGIIKTKTIYTSSFRVQ